MSTPAPSQAAPEDLVMWAILTSVRDGVVGVVKRPEQTPTMTRAYVTMRGRVHLDGAQVAIGDVQRMGKGWIARAYGQPAKTHQAALRRDAVAWVVSMWNELGKAIEQDG